MLGKLGWASTSFAITCHAPQDVRTREGQALSEVTASRLEIHIPGPSPCVSCRPPLPQRSCTCVLCTGSSQGSESSPASSTCPSLDSTRQAHLIFLHCVQLLRPGDFTIAARVRSETCKVLDFAGDAFFCSGSNQFLNDPSVHLLFFAVCGLCRSSPMISTSLSEPPPASIGTSESLFFTSFVSLDPVEELEL